MTKKTERVAKVLHQVKVLLDIAGGGVNIAESTAAAAKAEELMRKYDLAMSDVIMAELKGPGVKAAMGTVMAPGPLYNGDSAPEWAQWIAVECARLYDCQVQLKPIKSQQARIVTTLFQFSGYRSDVRVAQWTFSFLITAIGRHFVTFNSELIEQGNHGSYATLQRRSFLVGIAETLCRRLRQLKADRMADAAAQSDGRALVLYKTKAEAVAEHFGEERYRETGSSTENWSAYSAGCRVGMEIQLTQVVEPNEPKQIK